MQKDKVRDMLRSILPSKGDRAARFKKRNANKTNRVAVKQALRQYNKEEWGEDSEAVMDARIHNSDRRRSYEIRYMKMERRDADKISHFVRWCRERTKHLGEDATPQEKYYYISGLIGGPKDVIREHALGHYMNPDYDFNPTASWRYRYQMRRETEEGAGQGLFDRTAFREALEWAFETCPGHLNRALKGGRHGSAIAWHACTDDDPCTSRYVVRAPLYSYQTTWGFYKTEWRKPYSGYREGTLTFRLENREIEEHDSVLCPNKILVCSPEDIDRLVNRFFGPKGKVYSKGGGYYWRTNESHLFNRLIPFLLAKGALEDRS